MSWPDSMTAWAGEPAPALPLRDFLSRSSEIGFCADCLDNPDGKPCPDHRQDPAPAGTARSPED